RGCAQISINLHEPPMIGLNARRSEPKPGSIGDPAYRHDRKCRLGALPVAVPREDHSPPCRGLFERLDGSEVLVDGNARFPEHRRNDCRYIFILTRQDARASLEELD